MSYRRPRCNRKNGGRRLLFTRGCLWGARETRHFAFDMSQAMRVCTRRVAPFGYPHGSLANLRTARDGLGRQTNRPHVGGAQLHETVLIPDSTNELSKRAQP